MTRCARAPTPPVPCLNARGDQLRSVLEAFVAAGEDLGTGGCAPDGPTSGGRRLFDVFRGPHFTLLAVDTDTELPVSDGDLVRVHRTGAHEAYGKGLFLVRPAGYIGWAGAGASGLVQYLAPLGPAPLTHP
ncbi:aromatic-ring hydroxylase C-terminal domain-containing protein [Streptomyces sp. NPDC001732]